MCGLGFFEIAGAASIDNIIVTTRRAGSERALNAGNISLLALSQSLTLYPPDLLNQIAGVNIQRGSGQEHLTALRSPVLTGGAGAGSFLYMEDSISLRAPGFANVNGLIDVMLEDISHVEIIRGPGSALYGSNAQHGLINVIPVDPEDGGRFIGLSVGSYGRYQLTSASRYETPNSFSRLSVDLSGEEEGVRAASGFGEQKFRLQSKWETPRRIFKLNVSGMNLNQETAGYASDYTDEIIAKGNQDENAHRDAWSLRAALKIAQAFGSGKLILTPYVRKNDMIFRLHFLSTADPLEKNDHQSIGLLSAYHRPIRDNHLVIMGVDMEHTKGALWQFQTNPPRFGYLPGLHYDYAVKARLLSPYIHGEWQIGEATRLTTGLRYDLTKYDYDNHTQDGAFGRFLRPPDRMDDYETVSPKLGLTHQVSNHVIFVNLARASRAPQTTDLYRLRTGQAVGDLRPEQLDSSEIGLRTNKQGLSIELGVYHMKKKNYYFRDSNSENVSNGKTSHKGIEASLSGALSEKLSFDLSASYAKHQYEFSHTPNGIRAGTDIDSAPRKLAHLGIHYDIGADWKIRGRWHYVGRYATDEANRYFYEGHNLLDIGVGWSSSDDVSVDLRVYNVLARRYAHRADFAFGNARYFPGEPRRLSLRLMRHF